VGTEEGTIHKCSVSYNDDLDTYWGHAGPVYRVRTSPFHSHMMLSCSADWSVLVWNWKRDDPPALTCHSLDLKDAVTDIQWSPNTSTVFASAADDGRIEIWDLAVSNIDPIIVKHGNPEMKIPRTMVRFNEFFPVLVSGNCDGDVEVYRLLNMEHGQMTMEEQRERLERVIYPSGKGKSMEEDQDDDDHAQTNED
jgi:WD40 repeat protein